MSAVDTDFDHEHPATQFDDKERVIIGFVYLLPSLFTLFLHSSILIVFLRYNDLRSQIVYRIMLLIGISDCLQQTAHIYSGCVVLVETKFNVFIDKFFGGTANAAWITMIGLNLVLAIERLFIFRYFTRRGKVSRFIFLLCIPCIIFGFCFFGLYMTNFTGIEFDVENFYWSYNKDPWSATVGIIEYYSTMTTLVLTFLVYVIIFFIILTMKQNVTTTRNKSEYRLLIQSFFTFVCTALLICCWHYYDLFLPTSKWTGVSINVFWILFGALNPVLYLIMNSTIRRRFLAFVLMQAKPTSTIFVSTFNSGHQQPRNIS